MSAPVPNPPLPPIRLSRGTRRTLDAMTATVAPPEPVVPDREARIAAFAAAYLPYLPPLSRRLLPLGFWLFEWGPLIFLFALRPFSKLGPEARRRYLVSWQRSRWSLRRQMIKGLKALVVMGFYDMPEVQAHIGYEPSPYVEALVKQRAEDYARRGLPFVSEPHAPAGEPRPPASGSDARAAEPVAPPREPHATAEPQAAAREAEPSLRRGLPSRA